jgi:hypothetical protein
MTRIVLRQALTAIAAFVFLVIVSVNIEQVAEQHGWDQLLVTNETGVPNLFSSTPWWMWLAFTFFCGAALALWVNELLPRKERPKKVDANGQLELPQSRDELSGGGNRQPMAKSFMPYCDLSSAIFQFDFSGLWAKTEPHIEVIIYAVSLSEDQVTLTGVDGRLHIGGEECSLPSRLMNGPCELIERGRTYDCRIRQPLMPAMAQELTMGLSDMNLSTTDGRVRISFPAIRWVGTVQTAFGSIALNRIVSTESVLVRGPIRESDAEKVLWRVEPQFVSQVHYYLQDSSLRSQPTLGD